MCNHCARISWNFMTIFPNSVVEAFVLYEYLAKLLNSSRRLENGKKKKQAIRPISPCHQWRRYMNLCSFKIFRIQYLHRHAKMLNPECLEETKIQISSPLTTRWYRPVRITFKIKHTDEIFISKLFVIIRLLRFLEKKLPNSQLLKLLCSLSALHHIKWLENVIKSRKCWKSSFL